MNPVEKANRSSGKNSKIFSFPIKANLQTTDKVGKLQCKSKVNDVMYTKQKLLTTVCL